MSISIMVDFHMRRKLVKIYFQTIKIISIERPENFITWLLLHILRVELLV